MKKSYKVLFQPLIPEDIPRIPDQVFTDDCYGESGRSLPHPESCEFFFFCANDNSYLQVCGAGLIFDQTTGRCEMPQNAFCPLSTTQAPTVFA